MNDWTAGYVSEIGYAYGYYVELNPCARPSWARTASWVSDKA